jgi:integrase
VKQFVIFQSATKTHGTCTGYIAALNHFGNFITTCKPYFQPHQLNRAIVVEYINYLCTTSLQAVTRGYVLCNLRTFIEIVSLEEWLPFPKNRLIFHTDIPKGPAPVPRFIPEEIMSQLMHHLPSLPPCQRRFIFILQETGRRIGEICTLPFDCLQQDEQNDYFLEIHDHKTKKAYLIPITMECAETIKEQQAYLKSINHASLGYLFLGKSKKVPHAHARHMNWFLNKIAAEKQIRDAQGEIWHFHPHQFRHTVGTRMINAGVSQAIVQRYLGHESPDMTTRYAHIHDQTLKEAFIKFKGNLVNIRGETIADTSNRHTEGQWLNHNIMAQALPNGYCGLPAALNRCPHANACLTCTHFRTDKNFLSQHEHQLETTNEILETAKKHGWVRQIEMNQEVKINLETVITALKGKTHDAT